jgi:hypothetical protein
MKHYIRKENFPLTYKAQNIIMIANREREVQSMERKTTEATRRAIYRYDDKFERVNCRFAKGTKDRIEKLGYKSANDFIKLAVAEKLEHDEKILK